MFFYILNLRFVSSLKNMTFFKVNDPKNRELIKEVIAKRSIIREADRRRKMGEAFEFEQLSQFFKPITKQAEKMTEKIEKEVRGLPGEIAKILPRPINLQMPPQIPPIPQQRQLRRIRRQQSPLQLTPMLTERTMQPTYPFYYDGQTDETDTETVKSDKTDYINEKEISSFIKFKDGYYNFGGLPIKFKKNGEIEAMNTEGDFVKYTNSPKIYEIFTNKKTNLTWDDLDEKEKYDLGYISVLSDIFYDSDTGKKKRIVGNSKQWKNIFSHIWDERFAYMTPQMLESERTQKEIAQGKFKPSKIPEQYRKKVLSSMKKTRKKTGKGLKKDYVTLPSDPSELVDRLTLLAGSKDAGNTGVYNEMVSICDELLKRKIIGKGQYKQFLSNI